MTFLLEGVALGVSGAIDLDSFGLNLDGLSRTHTLDQSAIHAQASACGDAAEQLLVKLSYIHNHLNVTYARAVVQGDERHVFVTTFGAYPTFYGNIAVALLGAEYLCDSSFVCIEHSICNF